MPVIFSLTACQEVCRITMSINDGKINVTNGGSHSDYNKYNGAVENI